MILTCPECATRYQSDASLFAPEGRKVRCAKCGHVWFQVAPAPEPESVLEHEPSEAAAPAPQSTAYAASAEGAKPAEPEASGFRRLEILGLGIGWAALAGIVVAVAWSAVTFRQNIATLWPQTSSVYGALGLPVNTRGLSFRDKAAHYETVNGQDVLVITGHLVNITSHELTVPPVRVSLVDGERRELYHWNVSADAQMLAPGQVAQFRTRLSSPPFAARDIELRFSEEPN